MNPETRWDVRVVEALKEGLDEAVAQNNYAAISEIAAQLRNWHGFMKPLLGSPSNAE